ncbi:MULTISPECIES: YigZ family protein [Thiomicrorhabdus]|uniref:YigZ family protein n=1 Tax=Thiomicrorhabdus heinhorstiae TaxID=2748010 RepID=A0ABS0C0X1_9GAMM|nr:MULTISPECIES: YigZ family protein [Thiomicrorhabdus]MBF6058919.1 YigZ family protein [Thiomicrorhabdus heinhorstiae]
MSYPVPAEEAVAEIEIKKSRFIAYARGIDSREQGMQWLEEIKQQYPDARHHCWAYLIGNPHCASNAGMGDDGEPSGTAGKPILNVLQHKGVGDIMIIVVRYFGGIKLGAGGLTRAYGQAAQAVMEVLPTQQQVPMNDLLIECDFSQEQQVRHFCGQAEGQIVAVDYAQSVKMQLSLPQAATQGFQKQMEALGCIYKAN